MRRVLRCKTRELPALEVSQLLRQGGADVRYHDPYMPCIRHKHGDADARRSAQMGLDLAGW